MNILTYIPIPMPMLSHGGGSTPISPIAGIFLGATICFLFSSLLCLFVGLLADVVFNKKVSKYIDIALLLVLLGALALIVDIVCASFGV